MKAHEILGLLEGATTEEVTERYNRLVHQLENADLSGSPLQKDKDFRLLQLRAAFENLVYDIPIPDHLANVPPVEKPVGETDISNPYEQIEKAIDESRYEEAIRLLDSMDSHTAYWNYLYGFTLAQKGMVNDASHYLQQAVSMEPNDNDYQGFLNQINTVIEEQRQEEDRKKKQAVAAGAAGASCLCASCMCDACADGC